MGRGSHGGTSPLSSCSLHCHGGMDLALLGLTTHSPILTPMGCLHHLGLLELELVDVAFDGEPAHPDVASWVEAPAPWTRA